MTTMKTKYGKKALGNRYPLKVDYGRSIQDGIRMGQYDWVNPSIINFPIKRTDTTEVVVELVYFHPFIMTEDIPWMLDLMGCRPVELQELLVFGEKYPEVQKECPVVAVGSILWRCGRYRKHVPCVPYLGTHCSKRCLGLKCVESVWDEGYWFMAVRKSHYPLI